MPLRKDPLPRIAGIMTFGRAPVAELEDLRPGMVAVVGVPYDHSSTGDAGAREGPLRIREGSTYFGGIFEAGEVIDPLTGMRMRYPKGKLVDLSDMNVYPLDWEKTESTLREQMRAITSTGATPVILGGDHLVNYPLVLGYSDAIRSSQGGRIGYIQFSSQLDLGETDVLWGRVWRGTTAKRILDSKAVEPANMVWLGVNGYLPHNQIAVAEELSLNLFTLADIQRDGIEKVTQKALQTAGNSCAAIYVAIDVNCVDGAFMPGVDEPSFQGLRTTDLIKAVDILGRGNVGALSVVGSNPLVEEPTGGALSHRYGAWLAMRFIAPRILEIK